MTDAPAGGPDQPRRPKEPGRGAPAQGHGGQGRGWQGTEGWVHQAMLSGRRTAIVTTGRRAIRVEPARDARIVAEIEERVVGRLLACRPLWCRIEIAGLRGWIRRAVIWGVRDGETFD